MEAAENKSERLVQLEYLLLAHPQGLHRAEIARKLSVNRSTIGRYIDELSSRHTLPVPIYEDDGLLKVNRDKYLNNISLTIHEAMALHLATRLMATRTDKHNPYAASALRKLGQALATFAPLISQHLLASANVMDDAAQRHDPAYLGILETLTRAWSDGRLVHLWHKHEASGVVSEYDFAPYFIEPYAVGQTIHVIGLRRPPGKIRTLKVERIQRAELLAETYTIPADFNPQATLADAWGIWYTEAEPVEVALRFHPRVAGRVKESRWHRNEMITEQADGYLLWRAKIAEPQEMLPWIRGWGADCEVVEPEGLREEVKQHIWKLAQIYKLTTQSTDIDTRLLRLWGKTSKDPDRFHPALYHMFDVAHIAQQLLSPRASSRWRQVLGSALNADVTTLHEWLPFLIALHDLGKLSVPFQILNSKQQKRLQAEGFSFGKATLADSQKLHHSIVGRLVLGDILAAWPENLAAAFREMISGHHGIFQSEKWGQDSHFKQIREAEEWPQLRQQATQILASYLLQQWPDPLPNPANQSTAMMALNGFCILCDWLGSDEQYFTLAPLMSLAEYISHSRQRAHDRVREAGFFQISRSAAPTQFAALFFDIDPRPLQIAIDDIPIDLLRQPTLTIIEAPTGEGKTEAALALARRISDLRGTDEMYLALPTTATSNDMFRRIQIHLRKRLHLPADLAKLVHGQDFLVEDDLRIDPMESIELDNRSEPPALAWFAPKKKALLAPFGIGTIDQAELSALNVRHNALRMIGLAGKTVILDEVHAYDTYMTTIIKRMLTWLSALGSSVILLSATLPQSRRQELILAFASAGAGAELNLEAYPNLLTIGREAHHLCTPDPFQPHKIVFLHHQQFADEEADKKAAWLLEQVQAGGCACWITNTVKRAQQIYAKLLKTAPMDVDLSLLHARFPLTDRQIREKAIINKYGKTGTRPAKGIVVATQVLEQSLDLDFDVMMSDLAPIDLVLQRAGRLHRHERETAVRYTHQTPHLYLNTAIGTADKKIYTDYLLQKTLLALTDKEALALPTDYRPLIEAVYEEKPLTPDNPLYAAWIDLKNKRDKLEDEAEARLMNDPNPDSPFYHSGKMQDFKEDEEGSGWLVASTRWGQESITIIPLWKDEEIARTISGDLAAPLNQAADRETQLKLLRHSLRVSYPPLIKHLKGLEPDKLFSASALLQNCRPLWLEPGPEKGIFVNQKLSTPIYLHPELGLVIGNLSMEDDMEP
jgi:CRISPR-associated endonuclease/helicase Cas3